MEKILLKIEDVISFLDSVGWPEKAEWFRSCKTELQKSEKKRQIEIVMEIKKSLAGMGSFTDLPIKETSKLKMTMVEARKFQFRLAEDLGFSIDEFLKTS